MQMKKSSVVGVWIFSGTTHYEAMTRYQFHNKPYASEVNPSNIFHGYSNKNLHLLHIRIAQINFGENCVEKSIDLSPKSSFGR